MDTILETSRQVPVLARVDVCVLGGSCTGVSAAVRAARMGAKTAIVEMENCFGGAATAGMVCIWHSLMDTGFRNQIIGGTTSEILDRLRRRKHLLRENLATEGPARMDSLMAYYMNTEELKIELDEMVIESGVLPFLHTFFAAPYVKDGRLLGAFVENKSGRGVILADEFVDATADGDLAAALGCHFRAEAHKQPATTGARVYYDRDLPGEYQAIASRLPSLGIRDLGWMCDIPGVTGTKFWARSNVDIDCSTGEGLTRAEIEGRRQVRAMMDAIRQNEDGGADIALLALSSHIGIRETRQMKCRYQLTFEDIVYGKRFPDAIANGSYPPDIHHAERQGATYYYLDGVQVDTFHGLRPNEECRWRPETPESPTFWQVPYSCMIPDVAQDNVILCGRAIDADKGAFAAARVMVSMNQTGEAAGVGACIALSEKKAAGDIDPVALRAALAKGGSIML